MSLYSNGTLPCVFMSCMVAEGLFDGTGRDEKRALRQAAEAEYAFRVSKGYEKDTLWNRMKARLRAS